MNTIIIDDNQLDRAVIKKMLEKFSFVNLLGEYVGPVAATPIVQSGAVDLIILDIEMPEMSGLEFLKNSVSEPMVILMSSSSNHAMEAFEFSVMDYVLKPIQADRLFKALNRCLKTFETRQHASVIEKPGTESIFIRDKGLIQRLRTNEIDYVEAMGDYISIHAAKKRYTIRSTMKAIEDKLNTTQFIRVHRSFIIALDKIETIEENSIEIDGKIIPLGENYRSNFYKVLNVI